MYYVANNLRYMFHSCLLLVTIKGQLWEYTLHVHSMSEKSVPFCLSLLE